MQPTQSDPSYLQAIERAIDALTRATLATNPTWQPWTPTFTNLTIGNGTLVARYVKVGTTVHYYLSFTLGSTSAVGVVTVTLPVPPSSSYVANAVNGAQMGSFMFTDAGAAVYMGAGRLDANSVVQIAVLGAAGTYVNQPTSLTNLVPFTWGTGDLIHWYGTYEAAS